jgi:hypothetical protein
LTNVTRVLRRNRTVLDRWCVNMAVRLLPQHLIWIVNVALVAVVAALSWRSLESALGGIASGEQSGGDFAINVYGPITLISERIQPWSLADSVPRFGAYPAGPILPVPYLLLSPLRYLTLSHAFAVWMICALGGSLLAAYRLSRHFGVSRAISSTASLLASISPVAGFGRSLGQVAVCSLAAIALLCRPSQTQWAVPERVILTCLTAFMITKPTYLLTMLAAEVALRRRIWVTLRWGVVAAVGGFFALCWVGVQTDSSLGALASALRINASFHSTTLASGPSGDRVDVVNAAIGSPLWEMVTVCAVGLIVLTGLWCRRGDELSRLICALGLVTVLTYHHVYDLLPQLVVLLVLLARSSRKSALMLALMLAFAGLLFPGFPHPAYAMSIFSVGSLASYGWAAFVVAGSFPIAVVLHLVFETPTESEPKMAGSSSS